MVGQSRSRLCKHEFEVDEEVLKMCKKTEAVSGGIFTRFCSASAPSRY